MIPSVTIGIPTYRRPELLRRALRSVARQEQADLEVLIGDNATPGDETRLVVESFRDAIPGLRYVKHERNIGAVGNFMFLRDAAAGEYFMWLADDDEISANYVSTLRRMLNEHPDAAAATGHWTLMSDEQTGRPMPTSSFPQAFPIVRILRFLWRSDDAFFYALHRTRVIRQATFPGYWWPNRGTYLNWAYVLLFDVVARGKVLLARDPSVRFINHDYTPKDYTVNGSSLPGILARLSRRVNVHVLYWMKAARTLGITTVPLVMLASVGSVLRHFVSRLMRAPSGIARPGIQE